MVSRERALRGGDRRLRWRWCASPPTRPVRRSSPIAAASAIRAPRPNASPSPTRSRITPASICWRRCRRRAKATATCSRPRRGAAGSTSRTTTTGPTSSRKILVARVEPKLGIERPTMLCEYPRCEAALARASAARPTRRRTLRALCLRRRTRQRLRRTHRSGRTARPLRSRDGGEAAHLRRALSDRRGFPRRPRAHAAGQRRRARLRPPGDAGNRRAASIDDVLWTPAP